MSVAFNPGVARYSVAGLRAIALLLGIKATSKARREALVHEIATRIANYRGYKTLVASPRQRTECRIASVVRAPSLPSCPYRPKASKQTKSKASRANAAEVSRASPQTRRQTRCQELATRGHSWLLNRWSRPGNSILAAQ